MANTTLQVKKSGVTGNVPSSLEFGELALNYADGKLYYKASNGTITYIQSGTTTDSFATINANSSLILATSPTDTLSIAAGNNITISACTTTKTITINSQDADVDQFARNRANSALTLAQDAYNYANTISGGAAIDNVARTLAQSAYDKANLSITFAQAAYDQSNVSIGVDATQNTRLDSIETVNNNQNTSISIIQGVDLTQNTRLDGLDGVNLTQNTNITSVNQFAQSAYDTANGANGLAQGAYNSANNKLNLSGGTLTGSLVISANSDLTVTGNLTVLGNTFSVGTQTLEVVDPMIILANGNFSSDAVDIGFAGHYNDGSNAHTGLFRDYASKDWYLFQGYTPELSGNNNVDISDASFDTANLVAKRVTANIIATTVTISGRDQASVDVTQNNNITAVNQFASSAYDTANGANGLAASAFNTANGANGLAAGAFDTANGANGLAQSSYNTANGANGLAQGAFNLANTNSTTITAVNDYAQSAYATANGANGLAIAAYGHANNAFNSSNAVNGYAQAAYGTANGINALATSAYNQANNAFNSSNATNNFAQSAYNQANTATGLAQAAFNYANTLTVSSIDQFARDTANSASANTVIIQGVDSWQNTQITYVNQFAQAAFNQANTGGGGGGGGTTYNQSLNTTDPVIFSSVTFANNNSKMSGANTAPLTSTPNQIVDTFSTTQYRTVKYIIQAVDESAVHSTEVLLTHNDVDVFITEYATLQSASNLMSISANVSSSNVNLIISPTNSNTIIDYHRTALQAARSLGFSIFGDLMLQTGAEDLMIGSGSWDENT